MVGYESPFGYYSIGGGAAGERGPAGPAGANGTNGVGVSSITTVDNNDGSLSLTFNMSDGSTQGPFTNTLVSDTLINLNRLSLEGADNATKMTVKQNNTTTVFNVNTVTGITDIFQLNAVISGSQTFEVYNSGLRNLEITTDFPSSSVISTVDDLTNGKLKIKAGNLTIEGSGASHPLVLNSANDINLTPGVTNNTVITRLKADTLTVNTQTYTLPDTIPAPGFLQTDVSGNLEWAYHNNAEYSTGLIDGGALTVNANPILFNVSAGSGVISENGNATLVNWNAFIAQAIPDPLPLQPGGTPVSNITTRILTFVSIDNVGALALSANKPSPTNQRNYIYLGVLVHTLTINPIPDYTINVTNDQQVCTSYGINQLHDLASAIGFINMSGNTVNLGTGGGNKIAKDAGQIFAINSNTLNNEKSPHILDLSAVDTGLTGTFQYRNRNGTSSALTLTDVIPNLMDDGNDYNGTTPTLPVNKWGTSYVFVFTSNAVKIQPPQFSYATKEDALANIATEDFIVEPSIAANGLLIGYIIAKQGSTLQTDALFVKAPKFGNSGGGAAGTIDLSSRLAIDGTNAMTGTLSTLNIIPVVNDVYNIGQAGDKFLRLYCSEIYNEFINSTSYINLTTAVDTLTAVEVKNAALEDVLTIDTINKETKVYNKILIDDGIGDLSNSLGSLSITSSGGIDINPFGNLQLNTNGTSVLGFISSDRQTITHSGVNAIQIRDTTLTDVFNVNTASGQHGATITGTLNSSVQGDLFYAGASGVLTKLTKPASDGGYLSFESNAPVWRSREYGLLYMSFANGFSEPSGTGITETDQKILDLTSRTVGSSTSSLFTLNANNKLEYTGSTSRVFKVTLDISIRHTSTVQECCYVGMAKNQAVSGQATTGFLPGSIFRFCTTTKDEQLRYSTSSIIDLANGDDICITFNCETTANETMNIQTFSMCITEV